MENPDQLDPTTLQNLLGNSNTSLIPESLVTTLTVGFVVLNVISLLFLVLYILSFIHKWKMQSAVLKMQKDVAELKTLLQPISTLQPKSSTPPTPQAPPQPGDSNRMVASEANDSSLS